MRAPDGPNARRPASRLCCLAAAGLVGTAGAGGAREAFTMFGAGYCRAESDSDMSNQHPWTARTECIALEECQQTCADGDNGLPCAGLAWAEESVEDNSCKQAGNPRCNIYFGEEPVKATTAGYQEYACYVPSASQAAEGSGASDEGSANDSGSHNCSDGSEEGWSEEKKVFCCTQELLGCSFDCKAGASNWQAAWSPLKKAWCCKHDKKKGCQEDAPRTTTPEEGSSSTKALEEPHPPPPTTTPEEGTSSTKALEDSAASETPPPHDEDCDVLCSFAGQDESCRDRIQWVANNVFKDSPDEACTKGLERVLDDCPVCANCDPSEAHCVPPPSDGSNSSEAEDVVEDDADASNTTTDGGGAGGDAAAATAAASEDEAEGGGAGGDAAAAAAAASEDEAEGCDALCDYGGPQIDCRSRIQKAASQKLDEMSVSCELAHSMVLSHCPSCGRCVLSQAGCVDDGNTSSAGADGDADAHTAATPAPTEEDDAIANTTATPEQSTTSPASTSANATTLGPSTTAAPGEEDPPAQAEGPDNDDPRWERMPDTGCTNWADISLGDPVQQSTAEGCGQLCLDTAGCVGFGYQPGTCRVNESGGESLQGGCYLWDGDCAMGVNECWDEYTLTNATVPPGNSSTTPADTEEADDVGGGGGPSTTSEASASTTPEASSSTALGASSSTTLEASSTTSEASSSAALEASTTTGGPAPPTVETGDGELAANPPWWITHNVHPAEEKDMGSWTAVTFSKEQQKQYGVDEMGGLVDQARFDAAIAAVDNQTEAATADDSTTTAEQAAAEDPTTPPTAEQAAAEDPTTPPTAEQAAAEDPTTPPTAEEAAAEDPTTPPDLARAEQKFMLTADGEAPGRPRAGGRAPLSAAASAAALAALATLAAAAARVSSRRPSAGASADGEAEAPPGAQRWGYAPLRLLGPYAPAPASPEAASPGAAGGLLWPAAGPV